MVCNILLSDFVDLFCDRPLFEKKSDDEWRQLNQNFMNIYELEIHRPNVQGK